MQLAQRKHKVCNPNTFDMDDQYPLKILVDSNQLTPGNSAKVLNPFWKVVEREVHQQGYLEVFQKLSFKLVNWPEKSWPRSQGKPGSKSGQTGNIGKHPAGSSRHSCRFGLCRIRIRLVSICWPCQWRKSRPSHPPHLHSLKIHGANFQILKIWRQLIFLRT